MVDQPRIGDPFKYADPDFVPVKVLELAWLSFVQEIEYSVGSDRM